MKRGNLEVLADGRLQWPDGRVMRSLRPLRAYLWVEGVMVEESPSGLIFIPRMARPTVFAGNVLALPDGGLDGVRVGDGVLFRRKGPRPVHGEWEGTLRVPVAAVVGLIS